MAETPVVMPKMSMTMTEGEVVEILVSVGDQVSKGQVVAVVGTDKTDMEVESDHEGVVTEISAGPGDVIEVGAPLFLLRTEGEDLLAGMFGDPAQPAAAEAAAEPVETQAIAAPPTQAPSSDSPVLAMPGARKLAREQGIDLATITPASPLGVIKQSDLPEPGSREAKAREQIAKVVDTSTQIPQFSLSSTISISSALPEDSGERFVVLARAWLRTLAAFPKLNQQYREGDFFSVEQVRVAALVRSPLGFVAPTISAANFDEPNWKVSVQRILASARENQIAAENLSGATTSITDLGEFGVRQANTLLFPPQSSGFNVGALRPSGHGYEFDCTIVIDHRIADPGDGAQALAFFASEVQRELDVNS